METILKKENKAEANRLADAVQQMSEEQKRNLAAFMAGMQYATVLHIPSTCTAPVKKRQAAGGGLI